MTKTIKHMIITAVMIVTLIICCAVTSFAAESGIYFMANEDDSNTVINTQNVGNEKYLFLPSSADLSALTLYFDKAENVVFTTNDGMFIVESGVAFNFLSLFNGEQDKYTVAVVTDSDEYDLTVMKSENLRAMYLVSDDPVNYGRLWVDSSKSNEATGLISFVGTDGEVDYSNTLTELKGRGNSTFEDYNKKPYQIKIGKKADLINDNKNEANKKWVLLANMFDYSFIRNSLTFQLAMDLNMPYTCNFEPIDLYYDGEYRGTYLLTEKVEIDETRIDIENLDDLIEEANGDNEAYEEPVIITATTASKGDKRASANSNGSYKYVSGLNEPELQEGTEHHGYLLELEFNFRYPDEPTGFVTKRGQSIVTKNPEMLTKETGAYISALWQEFEDAVFSTDGYNTATGKYYYEYVDLDSLVKLYLINEFSKNYDGFRSSTYFYLPEDEDIMYAGPVWDFDLAYGISYRDRTPVSASTDKLYLAEKYLINKLLYIESFRDAVKAQLDPENGEFYNAVMDMLGEDGNIRVFSSQVEQSKKLNSVIWDGDIEDYVILVMEGDEKNYENSIKFLENYVEERLKWFSQSVESWICGDYIIESENGTYTNTKLTDFMSKLSSFFNKVSAWFSKVFS